MSDIEFIVNAIAENKCVLFLGAGASYSSKLQDDSPVPMGNMLAEIVYKKFYSNESYDGEDLQQVSSMVGATHGTEKLHAFLYELLNNVKPSVGLKNLTKFKWANIYTTNIEQAIEIAYNGEEEKAQNVLSVVGFNDKASENNNLDVTLYKLHGCITRKDIPLVFSLEEYATSKENHLKLFERLSIDLIEKSVVFVGYSMRDSNFQQIWATLLKYCRTSTLPNKYFFVGPGIKAPLAEYLTSKGFRYFNLGVDDFSELLLQNSRGKRETLQQYMEKNVAPVQIFGASALSSKDKYELSKDYVFPILELKKVGSVSNKNFYRGAEPEWADIKNSLDAKRDLLDDLAEDFNNWKSSPFFDFWLINGRSGDGKSALLKRFAAEISNILGEAVLFAHSRSTLDPQRVIDLSRSTGQPLVIFIDNLTDRSTKVNKLLSFLRKEKAKILIVGAARTSDWHVMNKEFFVKPKEFQLEKLSDDEINDILRKLRVNDSLDYLGQLSETEQVSLFKEMSDRELIVALREITSNKAFDEIIADEFSKLQSPEAKHAYLHICLINQLRYRIPLSLLVRVLNFEYSSVRDKVFKYTEGVIYFDDTRDETDYLLRARHSIIASVVVKLFFTEDVKRFEFLQSLIRSAIPSNPLEASLIKKLAHHSTVKELFSDSEVGVQCYNLLCDEFPEDSFLWQQRSLFLANNTEHFDESQSSIKKALRLNPHSFILKNTQGTLLLNRALEEKDLVKSTYLLEEGKRVLIESIRKSFGNNPYHYHSLINHLITWYKKFDQQNEKLLEEIQVLIEEASAKHPNDTMLITEQGRFHDLLEKSERAKGYFEKAIVLNPRNMSARYLLARINLKQNHLDEALKVCEEGIKLKNDEFFLNRLRFEIMHKAGKSVQHIKEEYIKSFTHFKDDHFLRLCCGAFLYINSDDFSTRIFSDLRLASFMSHKEKLKIVYEVNRFISSGNFQETGFVTKSNPTGFYLQTERFHSKTLSFLLKYKFKDSHKLKDKSRVRYKVMFSYLGPVAFDGELLQ